MVTKTIPYWHKVLKHFENKGYIHNGLTIPFLIGSRERLEPNENLFTIDQLVNSISEVGGTILKCPNIGEFIIGTVDTDTLIFKSTYPKTIDNIIITDNSLTSINSIIEMISFFENRYKEEINNRNYSLNSGKWGYFTQTELERIDELK